MSVRAEVEGLRELVRNARSMPMSASAVVNREELLAALDRLEEAHLRETGEAAGITARRDALVAEGESEAAEIVRRAELERDRLVSDTEVFRVAQREAGDVRSAAEEEAAALRRDADNYIEQRFSNFEHSLERTLAEVRRGIANLSGGGAFGADGEEPSGTFEVLGGSTTAGRHRNAGPGSDGVLLTGPEAG